MDDGMAPGNEFAGIYAQLLVIVCGVLICAMMIRARRRISITAKVDHLPLRCLEFLFVAVNVESHTNSACRESALSNSIEPLF